MGTQLPELVSFREVERRAKEEKKKIFFRRGTGGLYCRHPDGRLSRVRSGAKEGLQKSLDVIDSSEQVTILPDDLGRPLRNKGPKDPNALRCFG